MATLLHSDQLPASASVDRLPTPHACVGQKHWAGDASWAAVANLAQAAGPYCSLLLLARSKGLESAGLYAFSQSLSTPVLQLLSLQLKPLLLTLQESELPFQLAIRLRLWSTLFCGSLAAAAFVLMQPVLAVLLLCRLSESWGELYQTRWQIKAEMPRAALLCLARAACQIACIAWMPTLLSGLTAYLAASLLLLLLLEASDFHRKPQTLDPVQPNLHVTSSQPELISSWHSSVAWRILSRGVLLGGVLFLIALQSSIPRILLESYHGATALGVYATLGLLSQFGNLFFSSCGQGLLPRFQGARISQILAWLAIPAALGLVALLPLYYFREQICAALTGSNSLEPRELATRSFPRQTVEAFLAISLMQVVVWPSAIAGYVLTAFRLYRVQVWLTLLMLGTSGLLSIVLIPSAGAVGAAVASGSASLVFLLASVFLLVRSRSNSVLSKKVFA